MGNRQEGLGSRVAAAGRSRLPIPLALTGPAGAAHLGARAREQGAREDGELVQHGCACSGLTKIHHVLISWASEVAEDRWCVITPFPRGITTKHTKKLATQTSGGNCTCGVTHVPPASSFASRCNELGWSSPSCRSVRSFADSQPVARPQ